jgi:hypothetical protein
MNIAENTTDYTLPSGEIVTISIDIVGAEITVTDSRGDVIGRSRTRPEGRSSRKGRILHYLGIPGFPG